MLSRTSKALFYSVAGPMMKVNGWLYRRFRTPKNTELNVHLGPGQKNYLDGWVNVDANMFTAKCDLWADLRNTLPFQSGTVSAFYSHHMIEHLPDVYTHLEDAFRCLKPGGVYRVGGPNGDSAITKFIENDLHWFGDYPEKRESLGGRFENFIFCRGEHLTILTFSMLEEFMRDIGYVNIKARKPIKETGYRDVFESCLQKEYESDFDVPHTLIVEAEKP